jgi:hypothetical protein
MALKPVVGPESLAPTFSRIMDPAASTTQSPAALGDKAMGTILKMFQDAQAQDLAMTQALKPQLVGAPGGASPQAAHTIAGPVQAAMAPAAMPVSFASMLRR